MTITPYMYNIKKNEWFLAISHTLSEQLEAYLD
jgi:hypothetical protein